tara:strand:- start:28981 stop:29241 length:261 start_codon:yes stop_codon:yes gene_type:complete
MKSKSNSNKLSFIVNKDRLNIPHFSKDDLYDPNEGEIIQVEGTNVVRVPFGVRQPRKKRPDKNLSWATLVIPLHYSDMPTPPPHVA